MKKPAYGRSRCEYCGRVVTFKQLDSEQATYEQELYDTLGGVCEREICYHTFDCEDIK